MGKNVGVHMGIGHARSGTGILNQLATPPIVAMSVRLLNSNYSGSCMRLRRSSDSEEQDIGFDANGDVDASAISTFLGGDTGYIQSFYDQSGNGNDYVQNGGSSQAWWNAANKAIFFDTSRWLQNPSFSTGSNLITVAAVLERVGPPATLDLLTVIGGTDQNNRGTDYLHLDGYLNNPRIITDIGNDASTGGEYASGKHFWRGVNEGASSDIYLEIDGTEVARAAGAGDAIAQASHSSIGRFGTWGIQAYLQEFMIFPAIQTAGDIAALESDVGTEYTITMS